MSKTREVLNNLTERQQTYLRALAANAIEMERRGFTHVYEERKGTARGYIKGLVDCGVIEETDFRVLWVWWSVLLLEV